ncbi:MAG: tRNA (adenosine(37)-N6)-threonylcarbamoyltransferase complex dimerization subunit type 1 TsaB [Pseudomonadota bacterium]
MKLLALDTATEACSAAVWVEGAVHARFEIVGRDHTRRLIPIVTAVLAEAGLRYSQLDGLVCGLGPGSFAGVRIGVAFAKGVALAHALPVVGVSSLALLAQGALSAASAQRVLVAIDARMGEVYFQAYERAADGLAQAAGDAVVSAPGAVPVPSTPGPWLAAGTGWGSYEALLRTRLACEISQLDTAALPQAADALALALPVFQRGEAQAADAMQPVYLRNRVALTLLEQQQRRVENG